MQVVPFCCNVITVEVNGNPTAMCLSRMMPEMLKSPIASKDKVTRHVAF